MHKIPREKTIKNWTAMYWSDHKAQSRVIRGWIRVCMKRLENLWLSGSKIRQVAIPYTFPVHFPVRFLMFHLLLPSFFGYFSCFPRCLSLFPILGLTEKRLPFKKRYSLTWQLRNRLCRRIIPTCITFKTFY